MIYIIGTNHELQHTGCPKRAIDRGVDVARVEEARASLKELLRNLANTTHPKLIAEEFSEDVLLQLNSAVPIVRAVADELGIEHRFCDPGIAAREAIGVPAWGTEDCPAAQRRIFDEKREKYWLAKLLDVINEDVLFICGADHVKSFSVLLECAEIPAKIECEYFGRDIYAES